MVWAESHSLLCRSVETGIERIQFLWFRLRPPTLHHTRKQIRYLRQEFGPPFASRSSRQKLRAIMLPSGEHAGERPFYGIRHRVTANVWNELQNLRQKVMNPVL